MSIVLNYGRQGKNMTMITFAKKFLEPLWSIITFETTPCMSQDAMDVVSKIGDW